MRKDLSRTISIPEGVSVSVSGNVVVVSRGDASLTRTFDLRKVSLSSENNSIVISCNRSTRRESKRIGTLWAHINNMIAGVQEPFSYTLEVCHAHFPMNVSVEKNEIIIKSFLGETTQRRASIAKGATVDIKGTTITVSSSDIEAAGQTAANIEMATRLTGRDRRIFQDGIYITKKCGREI